MTDSPNNNTVMQRLLAERFLNKTGNDFSPPSVQKSAGKSDLTKNSHDEVHNVVDGGNSYLENTKVLAERSLVNLNIFAAKIPEESDPAARLDALCRSTLDNTSNFKEGCQKLGSFDQTKEKLPKKIDSTFPQKPSSCSASREVLLRLQKGLDDAEAEKFIRQPPSYSEAKAEADHIKKTKVGYCDPTNALISPRDTSLEAYRAQNYLGSNSYPMLDSDQFRKNASRPELQLHGHPKSNSGGDEYLYTDHVRKNNQRRGIRSKKNKYGLGRSSSLRHTPEETIHDIRQTSLNNLPSATKHSANGYENANGSLHSDNMTVLAQAKHSSSRSAPSQNSEEGRYAEKRRSSLHGNLLCLTEDSTSNFSTMSNNSLLQSQAHSRIDLNKSEMHQNHQEISQGTVPGNQAAYVRGLQGTYGSGPFYSAVTCHSMMGQTTTETNGVNHPSIVKSLGGNSPPRPPPPPYPSQYGEMDGHNTEVDVTSWQPQRPKSLPLGNCGKKKTVSNNGASQHSPCLTSPISSKCFSPMVRGTPFHNNVKEMPYVTSNGQVYVSNTSSPHQKQTSNGTNSYLRRSGSGNNVTSAPMTTSSSGSSTCTSATTPAYPDPQGFIDPGMRSPVGTGRYPVQALGMDHYGSGNGVNKSDSMNSASSGTTSGGGGASRIARRKRNSSSKPGFGSASCSGSSSNSGSRPNSMVDVNDRLEQENENLRNCLEVTTLKLKKYETLQVELQVITQSHQALQQTASNRERLEVEMRHQLTAELEKTKQERDNFKDEISTLKEQLKNMSMTSPNNDVNDPSRVNNSAPTASNETRKSQGRERELQEELEESRERISELNVDIGLLTSSLHKAQKTITVLKEKFLKTDHVDAYTEQLSKSLATLQKIVDERQEIEKELKSRLWKQLQSQRPFKSTSSNDEGISEMDTPDPLHSSAVDVYNSREGQMLGAKAEMLKWQHCYLEHGLLQHVHSDGSEATQHKRLYKALRNHRHAVSDPGFDKNPFIKTMLSGLDSNKSRNPLHGDAALAGSSSSSVPESGPNVKSEVRTEKTHFDSDFPVSNMTADCACQTPTSGWILGDGDKSDNEKLADHIETASTKNTIAAGGSLVEADSPSEGYHSQQSSGSPTPNVEKYSLHFTSLGEHTNPQTRDSHPGIFRRNRSADVLTSSHI